MALELRLKNKSYSQIRSELNVSKSTLSGWLSSLNWSNNITEKLTNDSKEKSRKNILLMNKRRLELMTVRHKLYIKEANDQFKGLKCNPLFIAGLCLYWGEGRKTGYGLVSVINTDVEIMRIVVKFYIKILKVQPSRLRGALFIYDDINEAAALSYWSKKLDLPVNQFIKTQILPSRSKLAKNKLQNGICNVYFSNTEIKIKIIQWVKLLALDMRE